MDDIELLKEYCGSLSVLYVEDDKELHKTVLRYLSKLFKSVDSAYDGEDGLLKYKSAEYDIVLCDINMPMLSGLEMSKKIKEINQEQEIIILSAHSDTHYFLDAIHIGVSDYIIKPINFTQMNAVLNKVAKVFHIKQENRLYHENLQKLVQEQTKSLTDNYEKTLTAMVDIIESRDSYTGGHSQRVANYSKLIAEKMKLSYEECNLIYKAGMLHDIGKVTTPDTILLKPGELTKTEYHLIKNHVNESYNLLSKIPMYKEISEIVVSHHERYDGLGYPNGLKGDEIPLLSQIMIIADAFDAMTTNRIYKGRKSVAEAIEEIKQNSAKQFDPLIVPFACEALFYVAIEKDINQLPSNTMEKERFAYFFRDNITDAYNKEYLDFFLQQTPKKYRAYIFFMKHFSCYNAKYGWEAGDILLKKFSNYLLSLYKNSLVFRIHGDDFIILSDELSDKDIKYTKPSFLENTGINVLFYKLDIYETLDAQINKLEVLKSNQNNDYC